MKKLLLALCLFSAGLWAQQTRITPDCVIPFSFTTGGSTSNLTCGAPNGAPNVPGIASWIMVYYNTGFSGLSLAVQSAPDNSGAPGSWGTFAGTVLTSTQYPGSSGINPNTATTSAFTGFAGYYPWMRVTLSGLTGSGKVKGALYGFLNSTLAKAGTGGGSSCSADINTACSEVVNLSHVTNASLANSGLVNDSTTVNGITCTLGGSCTVGGGPSASSCILASYNVGGTTTLNMANGCADVVATGTTTIAFSNITGYGPYFINVTNSVPTISPFTYPVAVTGLTQPDASSSNALSEICFENDGGTILPCAPGVSATASAAAKYAVLISNFPVGPAVGVGPDSTSGVPLLSQGSSAPPAFSTILYPSSATSGGIIGATSSTQLASSSTWPAGGIGYGLGAGSVPAATAAGTSKQILVSGGSSAPSFIDFPERYMIPAANCNNATAGAGWSIGSGGTVTCRAGTNNLGGFVSITDTSTTFAQFQVSIPTDWDSSTRPYILLAFESATDTTSGHTVIPEVAVSCPTATNGTSTDDVTLSAYQSLATVTFGSSAVAHGFYTTSVQIGSTQMSGCIAGGFMIVSIGRATDTATGVIGFEYADVTFPRLLSVQAN